jgi:ADP-L-glycero-D-manno-heptose 6-epimerase
MIVITGAAGFIGSVIGWRLNELGEKDLLMVDQKAPGSPKWENLKNRAFREYLESDDFVSRLSRGDFQNKITAIFHMGACSETTEMDRDYLRKNNTEYSALIADWCVKNNVYLSYASSAATYGAGDLGFSDKDSLTPRLAPLNPYGQSKLDFDKWVLKNGWEKKITGFRFFNVYGPNEYHKGHMRSMVHKGFEQIRSTGKIKLFKSYLQEYPDGGQKRDFIYVKDAVDAVIWFYQNPDKKGIFNLGTGKAQTWNELADALFKACGKPKNIEYVDMPDSIRNQYQYFTEADLQKLRSAGCPVSFGNIEAGTNDYVRQYLLKSDPHL